MRKGTFRTSSAEETMDLAAKIGAALMGQETVFLTGELGAGKTVFAKGLARGLGLKNIHQVCSPTFTLMNVYQARVPIFHFDLYRLSKADEIRELDFEDYLGRGVVVVEWAEKMPVPLDAVRITIRVEKSGRRSITVGKIRRAGKSLGRSSGTAPRSKERRRIAKRPSRGRPSRRPR